MKFFELLKRMTLYIIPILTIITFFEVSSFLIQQKKYQSSNVDFKTYIYKNLNKDIYGIWKQNKKQKNFFDNNKGLTVFKLRGDSKKFKKSIFKEGIDSIYINLTDRYKIATKHASVMLTNPQINANKDIISFPLQKMNLNITRNQKLSIDKKCTLSAKLYFSYNQKLNHQFLMLKLKSHDCNELNMKLSSNFEFQQIQNIKIITHFLFMLVAILFKYYFLMKLENQLNTDEKMSSQISLITVMMFASFELLLGLEQFVICSMHQMGFNLTILIGLLCFSLFFYNILRIVSLILKRQVQDQLQRNQNFNLKSFLINIYFKAHFTILGIFFLNIRFNGHKNLYLCWAFMLVPQILKTCFQKQRFISSNQNIIVYYFICMVIVCHTYFSQNYYSRVNRFKNSTDYVLTLIIMSGIQIMVLLLQEILSPFFFLPKFLLKSKFHNYFIKQEDLVTSLTQDEQTEENVCVICFQNLSENQDCDDLIEKIDSDKKIKDYILEQTQKYKLMKTPCEHYFHSKCLLTWMNIKMNCPMCKVNLPTFE